ncbi:inosine-5'-monophosphate dehydrogenase [mine drainage metagenome]|uniref:Inosine-5'-monophosphate dehydrogenase n=1 Tax=mine drainage metagenome TaxID=410659 RepID=T0ZKG8_9ZZZZ
MDSNNFYSKLADSQMAFTFDSVLLRPGRAVIEPKDADISTNFSKGIRLGIPFISSPMDTVTESRMAIAMARRGGIGVIHRNCSAEEELDMIKAVKRAESFIIRDVITIGRDKTVKDAFVIMQTHSISGLPVVEDGKLVGIVTNRDVRDEDPSAKIGNVMTSDVVTAAESINEADAVALMRKEKIEKLPVVGKDGSFKGLITYKDVKVKGKYKNALRDKDGRLLVAAAVSPFDLNRAKMLSGVADQLLIDVAHFHNSNVISATKKIIDEIGKPVIVGNLGTREGVLDTMSELDGGVAGLRMGLGSGSICITSDVTRAGSPTLYAVSQAAGALSELGVKDVPVIADGGMKNGGDAALALAFGADAVMFGYVFAACNESPSPVLDIEGKQFKKHRGMGSRAARERGAIVDRYADSGGKKIAEGIEMLVPYKGRVDDVLDELEGELKAAIGYAGRKNIPGMKDAEVLRSPPRERKL